MTRINDSYTVNELKKLAKDCKIKNFSKMNKLALCEAIIEVEMMYSTCELPEVATEEVKEYDQTPEETTNKSLEYDLENCDDVMNMACTLTSAIDQNPLWENRSCELPETPVTESEEINLIYWAGWDSAYWKALVKMRNNPSNKAESLPPESLLVTVALLQIMTEVLIKSVITVAYAAFTIAREALIYAELIKTSFKAAVRTSKMLPKLT